MSERKVRLSHHSHREDLLDVVFWHVRVVFVGLFVVWRVALLSDLFLLCHHESKSSFGKNPDL